MTYLELEPPRTSRKTFALIGVACLVSAVLASTATAMMMQDGDTIKSKRFVLLNQDGKLAGVWSTGKKDNLPCIVMVDGDQKVRISIALTADGSPAISFTDNEERSKIGFAVTKSGDSAITLMNAKGDVRAALAVEGDQGELQLNGKKRTE